MNNGVVHFEKLVSSSMALATFILTPLGCTLVPCYPLSMANRGEQTTAASSEQFLHSYISGGKKIKRTLISSDMESARNSSLKFIVTRPSPFVEVLSMLAFALRWQNRAIVIETHKAQIIYYLALYRKHLVTPDGRDCQSSGKNSNRAYIMGQC